MKDHFTNRQGYSLVKLRDKRWGCFWSASIYEFKLADKNPLTFWRPVAEGSLKFERIQPDRHIAETDMGSIPPMFQSLFPKDRFLLSYLFHDSAYKHHGLYFAECGSEVFKYQEMNRLAVDMLLRDMIEIEGGGLIKRRSIYRAVRMFGGLSWKNGKAPAPSA